MFTEEPQDTVIFKQDGAGNSASLVLNCNASGDRPPTIAWYREGNHLSSELVNANGTLLIVNITEGVMPHVRVCPTTALQTTPLE